MKLFVSLIVLLIPLVADSQPLEYPVAPRNPVVDTFYGTAISDDYRWLENPNNQQTMDWIEQQKMFTKKTLRKQKSKFNTHVAIDKYSYVKYDNPVKRGKYYFNYAYYNNVGLPALFYREGLKDQPTLLLDPNFISGKDNIMIKGYSVSKDSKLLAYQFSRNGSDWGEIKIMNLKRSSNLKDHLKNVKFSSIAWRENGFYYTTFPNEGLGKTQGQEVYYHTIGNEQEQDKLIFRRANNPLAFFYVMTTSDERFLILEETNRKNGMTNIFFIDFMNEIPALKPLITRLEEEEDLYVLGNLNDELIASTFKNGNNGMIVKIDPDNPREWKVIVPEFKSALLLNVRLMENQIIAKYQSNRRQQISFFDYEGTLLSNIEFPFGFSVNGFSGEKTDTLLLFSYSSYTQPKIVYVFNINTYEKEPLKETVVNFDHTRFETKELEYPSKDGTKIPLFLIHRKGLDLTAENPTLLKAYGGFGVISSPGFSPGIVHFVKKGGVFAFANIRGGGDKGKEWAQSGKGEFKQNSFDDFIAAAEFLIKEKYTNSSKLGITGASNGGLVVGVAMTQRPELFKVAVPVVAPLDMLRFEQFTIGHLHANEYGSVEDSAGFRSLLSYSPLHNIRTDVNYPTTLIMTSENDDRVPPLHSYKFAASLQNRQVQTNPILLRIEKNAGHYGAASNFKRLLKEEGDFYGFIMNNLFE